MGHPVNLISIPIVSEMEKAQNSAKAYYDIKGFQIHQRAREKGNQNNSGRVLFLVRIFSGKIYDVFFLIWNL